MRVIEVQGPGVREPTMADLAPLQTARTIVGLEHDAKGVTLLWDDGVRSRFHVLWLRDNCPCPRCRHSQAFERTFMFIDHAEPLIVSAELDSGGLLEIEYRQGDESHVSRYTKGWLRAHDITESAVQSRRSMPKLWDAQIASRLPRLDYVRYMETSSGLRPWIEALKIHGIVLLTGVPGESGKLLDVARRIGPVRASNFGEYYDVVSMANPNASAYTQMGLELHTDLSNWREPPDVQLLFCLKSSVTGGESVFADGFRVAEDLRIADPEAFRLLSTYPVEYRFHDEQCDIRTSAPVIAVDRDGGLTRVRFNNWLRAALIAPENMVEPLYGALGKFWRMLRESKYRLNVRLEPGQLIAYDNNRVLHGRAPFDASSGERHLQGCYLNKEDLDSRLRLLDRLDTD
ncbi:MAG: TauD/TfdA family dioxygenase [Steroidobacteraceae bacterium]